MLVGRGDLALSVIVLVLTQLTFGLGDAMANFDQKILRMSDRKEMLSKEFGREFDGIRYVVLAEVHDNLAVQKAQAASMQAILNRQSRVDFTTAWEFLDFSDQASVADAYSRFHSGEFVGDQFMKLLFPSASSSVPHPSYLPIFNVTSEHNGHLLSTNLSRSEKAPVVQGGIANAMPGTVPDGFAMGGAGYEKRFTDVMSGGHANQSQIANYFAAQCLTDDVIAKHLVEESSDFLKFLVIGSFHADYNDGVVKRIQVRDAESEVKVIRFIDVSDYAESEIEAAIQDPAYGAVGDYVWFVNEPAAE